MADLRTIARPYAKAVFRIAKQDDQFESWRMALKIDREIIENDTAQLLLDDPSVMTEEKLQLFLQIQQQFKETDVIVGKHQQFISLLLQNQRLVLIDEIYNLYKKYLEKHEGYVAVKVDSAEPLTQDQQKELEQRLEAYFNKKIKTSYQVKSDLIGGVSLRTSHKVLDGTVLSALEKLRNQLIMN